MWKWMGLFLRKNNLLRCWGWHSLLNWIGALTLFLLIKLPPRKLESWFILWIFLLRLLCISIYKSTTRPCMEYCCHIWGGAPSCYLKLLDNLLKRICRTIGASFAASLEPLAHRRNIATIRLFYRYYFGRCSSELVNWFHFLILEGGLLVILTGCMIFVTIPRCYKDVHVNSFFPRTTRLGNSLPIECLTILWGWRLKGQ